MLFSLFSLMAKIYEHHWKSKNIKKAAESGMQKIIHEYVVIFVPSSNNIIF